MGRFYQRAGGRAPSHTVLTRAAMTSYGLKLAGAAIFLIVVGGLAIWLFGSIWLQRGLGAAFLVVGGGLLLLAGRVDRKRRKAREGLDELPPIEAFPSRVASSGTAMSRSALFAALAVALAAGSLTRTLPGRGEARQARATVDWVTDGDTLRIRGGERVRLLQIDAPEAGEECYAGRATAELVRLTPRGSRVLLESDAELDLRDRYGRLLRYVLRGQLNVNVELVRRGAATPYFYKGDRGRYAARLLEAVAEARRARRGMWSACRVSWSPESPVTTRSR